MIQNNKQKIEELINNGIVPYSISKLNTIDGCHREAYYAYKDTEAKKKRLGSIYGVMGGKIHEVIEKIYSNELGTESLLPAMQQELKDAEIIGVDFPKDSRGGTSIRDNWVSDMSHFCNNFEQIDGTKFSIEELVLLKVNDKRYLRGYIDLVNIIDEEKKIIEIYDFKTSAKFKPSDLIHHGRQLIVYGMAKEQEGYTIRKLAWVMLKYVEVTYEWFKRSNSKEKAKITKIIQRGKLAKTLSPIVESMLYQKGYNDIDIDIIISNFQTTNALESLPSDVRRLFSVHQYIQEYEYTDDLKKEALDYINQKADEFEGLWDKDKPEWKPLTIDKNSSFYCNNLCAFREVCDELKKYNSLLDLNESEDEDLF